MISRALPTGTIDDVSDVMICRNDCTHPVMFESVEPCEALDGEKEQMRAPSVEIQTRVDLGAYSPQQLLEAEEIEEEGPHLWCLLRARQVL